MKFQKIAHSILTFSLIFFIAAIQANKSTSMNILKTNDVELPSALLEDDSFNDLPFEQLRQALREEVELDPDKKIKTLPSKRYNILIR